MTRGRWGSRALALSVVLWIGAVAAVPAAADQRVVSVPPVFYPDATLSAYHGLMVMGGHALGEPPSFLAVSDGAVTRLPINAPRGGGSLGRLDLGPGTRGGTEAVYERCHSTTDDSPSGCDIYRYDVASRRTRPVAGASSRRYEERSPSMWRGHLAFVRSRLNRKEEFISAGPGLGVFATPPLVGLAHLALPTHRGQRVGIAQADLRGQTIAYVTFDYRLRSDRMRLLVKRVNRRGRGRACEIAHGPVVGLSAPQIDGDYVYWRRDTFDSVLSWTIHRRRIPEPDCHSRGPEQVLRKTFRPSYPPSQSVLPLSYAVDQGHLYYSLDVTDHPQVGGVNLSIDHGEISEVQPVVFKDL